MPYTKFAIAGAGNLGRFILDELLRIPNTSIKVLTRSASTFTALDAYSTSKIEIAEVDYSNLESLQNSLKEVETLICTFPPRPDTQSLQFKLVDAAKNVGCKLFVPSEFGNSTLEQKPGERHELKLKVQNYAAERGLPTLLVFNGAMADMLLRAPPFGFDWHNGKLTIIEGGDYPITMTARVDIARFLIHALTHFPNEDLENRILRLEGDKQTPLQLAKIWEDLKPGQEALNIVNKTLNDLRNEEENSPLGVVKHVKGAVLYNYTTWFQGTGSVGEPISNSLWPDWNPLSAKDIMTGISGETHRS